MTWGRGFYRAWIMFTVVWIAGCGWFFGPRFSDDWQRKSATDALSVAAPGAVPLVPIDCKLARGRGGSLKDKADYEETDGKCWYMFPTDFRRLFPEYNDVSDDRLMVSLYEKVGTRLAQPFEVFKQFMAFAICVPLVLLLLGAGLTWVFRGFKAPSSVAND